MKDTVSLKINEMIDATKSKLWKKEKELKEKQGKFYFLTRKIIAKDIKELHIKLKILYELQNELVEE